MKVQIQTTQNVTLEYEVADLGHRIGATLIDWFIVIAYLVGISMIIPELMRSIESESLQVILMIIAGIPFLFYNLLFEVFMNGQTIGKKAVNIRVVRLDGGEPTLGGYLLRWMLGLFEIYSFMGVPAMLAVLISAKGQRIGDRAAGTTVVRVRPAATLADTIYVPTADDYVPTYQQVTLLSDQDIAVIKEVVDSETHRQNPTIVAAVTERVARVLGVPLDTPPLIFLHTVINDYNHITSQL